jgi:hypothetical protein|tara:strand:+ start:2813 stop:3067 length:255 start_codon:yes stop_codon:yes gene_type:complete
MSTRAFTFQYGHPDNILVDITDLIYNTVQVGGVLTLAQDDSWDSILGDPIPLTAKFIYVHSATTNELIESHEQGDGFTLTGLFI